MAVCTVGVVALLVSGGKPGCSYRGFPQPTLSTPCDPGSQSGRPGSLSPNQSVQSWALWCDPDASDTKRFIFFVFVPCLSFYCRL